MRLTSSARSASEAFVITEIEPRVVIRAPKGFSCRMPSEARYIRGRTWLNGVIADGPVRAHDDPAMKGNDILGVGRAQRLV